jgi:hypothetical protein
MAKQSTPTRKRAGSARTKKQKVESAPSQNGQDVSGFEQELAEYLQERIKPGLNRGAIPMLARSIAKDIARRQSSDDAQSGDDGESNPTDAEADEDRTRAEADDVEAAEDEDTQAEADDDEIEGEADYDEEAEGDDDIEAEAEADDDDVEAESDDDYEDDAEEDDDVEAEADDEYEDEAEDDDVEAEADDEYEDEAEAESNGNGSTDFEADMRELQGELGDDWILRFSVHGDESWLTAEKDDGSQRVQASTASVLSEVVELLNEEDG